MTNKEIIKVLDDMKVKIRIPEAAVTQLKRNAALDEAIKRFKQPNIKILSKREAVNILASATPYSVYQWIRTLEEIEALGLRICEVKV